MKSLARSQAARRRAAAAAAIAGVGAGILGTQSAEATPVTINLASFGMTGVNAGLASGGLQFIDNFPTKGGGGFYVLNNYSSGTGIFAGVVRFATGAQSYNPVNFAAGTLIDATAGGGAFTSGGISDYYSLFKLSSHVSPNFGPNSFLGFRDALGRYGWIKTTWDGKNFQLYSGAYESVVGASIKAGQTSSAPVPEIDPSGLASAMSLVMGSAAMLEQRRRKRAAVAAEAAAVTA